MQNLATSRFCLQDGGNDNTDNTSKTTKASKRVKWKSTKKTSKNPRLLLDSSLKSLLVSLAHSSRSSASSTCAESDSLTSESASACSTKDSSSSSKDDSTQQNLSRIESLYENESEFLTTIFENLEPYIDTYAVYKRCVEAGFTPSQSDEIINLLIAQLNTKLSKLLTKYSQIYELENEQYLFESAKQELGVDVTRNREHHIKEAINLINELRRDYLVLSDELNNSLINLKNDIQIAINERASENTLTCKNTNLQIQETNHKVTTEITMAMRSEIESLRWHLSRWGVLTILTCVMSAFFSFYMYRRRMQKKQAKSKAEFAPLLIYEPSEFDDDNDYHADLDPDSV